MEKIKFSPFFVIICIFLGFFSGILQFLTYFLVVMLHEMAHAWQAKRLGYTISHFYFMPYGACLGLSENTFYSSDEIKIALAGPLLNITLSIICASLWWCFPSLYYYLDYFCFCNIILGLFNLLPCFPLDGGRVFVFLMSSWLGEKKAKKTSLILNLIVSAVLIVLFISSIKRGVNFTFLYISVFLLGGMVDTQKYADVLPRVLSFDIKKVHRGAKVNAFAVSEDMPLFKIVSICSKNKFNVVYVVYKSKKVKVVSENSLILLCENFSPYYEIGKII